MLDNGDHSLFPLNQSEKESHSHGANQRRRLIRVESFNKRKKISDSVQLGPSTIRPTMSPFATLPIELQERGIELQERGIELQERRIELQERGIELQGRGIELQEPIQAVRIY